MKPTMHLRHVWGTDFDIELCQETRALMVQQWWEIESEEELQKIAEPPPEDQYDWPHLQARRLRLIRDRGEWRNLLSTVSDSELPPEQE